MNAWTSVGPDGASIYGGVSHVPRAGTAIAVTTQGIYRTTDNGQHWSRTLQFGSYGFYQGVAASWNPAAPDVVLAHGDGRSEIARSVDGGATWSHVPVTTSASHTSTAAFTRSGAFAWAGRSNGEMFRSSDAGATWIPRGNGLTTSGFPINQLEVDATADDTVYAVSGNDFWRTQDNGANWTKLNASNDPVYRVAPSRKTHNVVLALKLGINPGIYRSTDAGTTFTLAIAGEYSAVEFFPNTPGRALALRGDQTVYTDDDGQTWTARGRLTTVGTPLRMSFDRIAEQNVMVGTNGGLAFSADGGNTWSVRNGGMRELGIAALAASHASGTNAMYALSLDDQMVYRRDPTTRQWTGIGSQVATVVTQTPGYQGYGIAVSRLTPGTLYVINNGRFGRSTTDGASWTALGSVIEGRSITFDPVDPQLIYVASLSSSMKSADGGATWTNIGGGLPPGIQDIVVEAANSNVLYAAKSFYNNPTPSTIYKSTDKGITWMGLGTGMPDDWVWRLVKHPDQAGTLYAGAQSGLWRSVDGAATWTRIFSGTAGSGSVFDVVIDPVKTNILYLVSNGYPGDSARSIDGGATWEPLRVSGIGLSDPLPLFCGSYRESRPR